jgi:hypothetical protein
MLVSGRLCGVISLDLVANLERIMRCRGVGIRGLAEVRLMYRFFVRATSVNQVRRALGRAPGGARVIGRFDRETIECQHTMNEQSYQRHWPVLESRLERAGLMVVESPRKVDVD